MEQKSWFEISNDGWRRIQKGRPLGILLQEALQNAFDAGANRVEIVFLENEILIEDNAPCGIADERLIYTLFYSDKSVSEGKRGYRGRGIKELISVFDNTIVETVGTTIFFDETGRTSQANQRAKGTRLTLQKPISLEEKNAAKQILQLIIPAYRTKLYIDTVQIERPSLFLSLSPVDLETVLVKNGVESRVNWNTEIRLYHPRSLEKPYLYELGFPLQPTNMPWHIDIQQRVPRAEGAVGPDDAYLLRLKLWLFESLLPRHLQKRELRADWIQDVLSKTLPNTQALDAYISNTLPRNAVFSSSSRSDEGARKLGAQVLKTSYFSLGVHRTLSKVLESSDDFIKRKEQEANPLPTRPTQREAIIGEFARYLSFRLLGFRPRIAYFSCVPLQSGLIIDAVYQKKEKLLSINILGRFQFEDPFCPQNLKILLHELSHEASAVDNMGFISALEDLFSRAVYLLAEELPTLKERFLKKLPLDPEEANTEEGATRIARIQLDKVEEVQDEEIENIEEIR